MPRALLLGARATVDLTATPLRLFLLGFLLLPVAASGQPHEVRDDDGRAGESGGPVCLVRPGAPHGEDPFLATLRIETRKRGTAWTWVPAERPDDCPTGRPSVVLAAPGRAELVRPGMARHIISLEDTPATARPRALAHAVLSALATPPRAASVPRPPQDGVPAVAVDDVPGDDPSRIAANPAVVVRLGGAFLYQVDADRATGGPALEVGVSLFDDQLALSVAGSYAMCGERTASGRSELLQAPELLAMARGGYRLRSLVLRVGVGGGWQRVAAQGNTDRTERGLLSGKASEDRGAIAGDLELLWKLSPRWEVSALFNTRVYIGKARRLEALLEGYRLPRWAAGGQLLLGVRL